jgi:hypothetical protein
MARIHFRHDCPPPQHSRHDNLSIRSGVQTATAGATGAAFWDIADVAWRLFILALSGAKADIANL